MALVINDIVKMEWEKSGWLQTKATKNKPAVFILASKAYETADGKTVYVYFNANTAFLWGDDEDGLWDAADLKDWLKTEYDYSFPEQYDSYIIVIPNGSDVCDESVLERYGLTEYKEDIEKRLKDVRPYGEEEEVDM